MATAFTFILEPPAPSQGSQGTVAAAGASPIDTFLGFGLTRPFSREAGDFASAGGEALVRSAVGQVLGTRAQSPVGLVPGAEGEQALGELPWRPEFGSKFYLLRHRRGRLLEEMARVFAQEAFARWEPRIVITNVASDFSRSSRQQRIRISFDLVDQNVPGNNVLLSSSVTLVSST